MSTSPEVLVLRTPVGMSEFLRSVMENASWSRLMCIAPVFITPEDSFGGIDLRGQVHRVNLGYHHPHLDMFTVGLESYGSWIMGPSKFSPEVRAVVRTVRAVHLIIGSDNLNDPGVWDWYKGRTGIVPAGFGEWSEAGATPYKKRPWPVTNQVSLGVAGIRQEMDDARTSYWSKKLEST